MATLTATRAAATFPANAGDYGNLHAAYGTYTLAANPTAADIAKMCRLPANATVLAGFVRGQDIDTGSGVFDMDVGWPANGGTTTSDAADPDGFGNFGALNGTAVTNVLPEGGIMLQLNGTLAAGPVTFTRETVIQIVFNVAANAGGTGVLTVVVYYVMP